MPKANKVKGPPYEIPDGLTDMLQQFVVHLLRHQPEDLVDCATEYFLDLQGMKQPLDSIKVGKYQVISHNNVAPSKSRNNNNADEAKLQQLSECLIAASKQNISQAHFATTELDDGK